MSWNLEVIAAVESLSLGVSKFVELIKVSDPIPVPLRNEVRQPASIWGEP